MIELDRLLNLSDDLTLSCISTAEGVRTYLSTRSEVLALRVSLESGGTTFGDVKAFVRGLISSFVPGTLSPADAVLAAVVAAIEPLPQVAIEEFLDDLARVKVAEIPMSPRVARLSVRERRKRLAQVTFRDFRITSPVHQADGPREHHPPRISSGQDYGLLNMRVA
jgi:hypothetical protein